LPIHEGSIKKGEVRNPNGYSIWKRKDSSRAADLEKIKDHCLIDILKIIDRWRHLALTEEPKYAFQYGKDLMDRGLGKAVQTAIIKTGEGQSMSMQTAYDALNRTIEIEEERNQLKLEVEELKKQMALLTGKKIGKSKTLTIENGKVINNG
jgi:hypothetical protein